MALQCSASRRCSLALVGPDQAKFDRRIRYNSLLDYEAPDIWLGHPAAVNFLARLSQFLHNALEYLASELKFKLLKILILRVRRQSRLAWFENRDLILECLP